MGIKKEHRSGYRRHNWSYRFSWVHLMRPLTFTGTIGPVLAGTVLAAKKGHVRADMFAAMFVASLLVQAATNMLNDYFDVLRGQDRDKWAAPGDPSFGRGPAHHAIPAVAGVMLAAAALLGAYLAWHSHLWIAIAGALGILFGYAYSAGPRPLSSLGLGELVAAVFMGPVTTALAYTVQGDPPDVQVFAVSLPFALLIASMILSNNIRDIEKDRTFRHTLAIVLGRAGAVHLLSVILTLAYLSMISLIAFHIVPWTAGAALLALPLAIRLRWCFRHGAERMDEISGMKWAAWHHWVFGLLFVFGISL